MKTQSIPIATQKLTASKKRIHQPSDTRKKTLRHVKLQNIINSSKQQSIMGIKSISMTVEARYTTRPSEEERAVRIKSIPIAAETYCTTKKLTASRRMKTIHNAEENKSNMTAQRTSTNPTKIMEQTPWPGNHEYKPWPGYTQARLLWTYQTNIYNGNPQADSNLGHPKTTPRDTKINILDEPLTMAKTQRHREQHPEKT